MLFEYLLLQRSINKLTVDDFNFDIGTNIGTLNPNEVKLIHTTKKINNTTEYTISVPCVNSSFDNNFSIKVLSRPQIQHITLSDLAIYEEYKKSNSEYDLIETEVFYIGAEFKNRKILDNINYYTRDYNKKNKTQLIPDVFVYCNWNIPPFIMEERQFIEYAKKQLVISIRTFLHRALI